MRGLLLALALALVCKAADTLVDLTAAQHEGFLREHQHAVIFYYVPWCYWCRKFMPVYQDAASATMGAFTPLGSDVDKPVFGRIDLNQKENKPIVDKEDITGFPTVKLHMGRGNSSLTYNDEQAFQPFMRWLLEKTTSRMEVHSPEQLTGLLKLHHSDIVCLMVNPTPQIEAAYATLGTTNSKIMFGTARGEDMALHMLETYEKGTSQASARGRIDNLKQKPSSPFLILLNPHHYSDDPNRFTYDRSHLEYLAHIFPQHERQDHLLEDPKAMEQFIRAYQFPVISRWNSDLGSQLVEEQRPFLVAFRHFNSTIEEHMVEDEETFEERDKLLLHVEDVLWDVGKRYRSSMAVVISGIDKLSERRLMSTLAVERTPMLVYVAQNPAGTGIFSPTLRYYAPDELVDMVFTITDPANPAAATRKAIEDLKTWIGDIQTGRIQPSIKSEEPLPETSNQGPVRMLVGRNFKKEVVDSSDEVVVNFHAPWCGHCRVLAPTYEKVARAFRRAGVTRFRFAKIDATANEVPGLHLRGYPTILLYSPKMKDRPAEHTGGVEKAEDLIRWLHQKASIKFDVNRVVKALEQADEPDDLPKLIEEL